MDTQKRIKCDQCEALMINGVFCHETGCPNSKKTWEDGEWIRYLDCFECGAKVREEELCNCQEPAPKQPHYIAMAGLPGCLSQYCATHDTYQAAVDDLAQVHELGRSRKAQLKRDGSLELNLYRDGNEYCEIIKCDCADPSVHSNS